MSNNSNSTQFKITTAIIFITGLLMVMTLFASCSTTQSTAKIYGNPDGSRCAAYD